MDNGTRVLIVVPSGPNAGAVCGSGVIVGKLISGIDGTVYYVREADGTTHEHGAGWLVRAR